MQIVVDVSIDILCIVHDPINYFLLFVPSERQPPETSGLGPNDPLVPLKQGLSVG